MDRIKRKIIITVTTLILFCISYCTCSNALANEYYLGDINQDQKINIVDELKLLRYIYAYKTNKKTEWLLTQDERTYADINEDNEVDLSDVLAIKRYIAADKSESVKLKHPKWIELCKKIKRNEEPAPNPNPTPTPDPKPDPNPDPTPTPDPKPDPNPDPTPTPDPKPDPNPDPTPTPDPKPDPNPDPTPTPDPEPDPTPSVIEPKGIILNKTIVNLQIGKNEVEQLTATIQPENANASLKLTWNSSNETVATVSQEGLVTAKTSGKTIITVSTENKKIATCNVFVAKEEIADLVPIVNISKQYEGDIITAGTTIIYPIKILSNNVVNVDTSKVKLTGSLADKSKLEVSGSGNLYNAKVTVADEIGTLGIFIEQGMLTNDIGNKNVKTSELKSYVFSLNTTTSSSDITATVGVHNSFYIKKYDFYLGETKIIGDSTTNEYTYTKLSQGNTYKIKVFVEVYKDKISDTITSGWVEKEVTVGEDNNVEVHFIDVTLKNSGAADCIFIKTAKGKTIMIDTGADNKDNSYANKVDDIDRYLRKEKNSKNKTALVKASNGIVKVDYLILTHSHWDHIGGFAGLTGVHYKANSPGYKLNTSNKINGETIRYEFNKIIMGCNVESFKGDEILSKDGVNIKDGAEGNNTTSKAKLKAIYCYAKATNKLKKVVAGNSFKVDNIVLNIFNPYSSKDVPKSWLATDYNGEGEHTSGIRKRVNTLNKDGKKEVTSLTSTNNNSIVLKLISGNRRMLLTGDAEFFAEEILLGIPAKQIKQNDATQKGGLAVSSSNGGVKKDSTKITSYTSLVYELLQNNYGGCKTISELEEKYKLSRLTAKDLNAQILKKGHHGVRNSTSIPFLNIVTPNKIVTTGRGNYADSTIKGVDVAVDYRIRKYYNSSKAGTSSGAIELTGSNWYKSIFCTATDKENKCKGSFYISTENGTSWNYTDPNAK